MKLSDLTPDTRNANKGTPRGRKLVRESLKRYGAGRSILLDKNGAIIAGNKTAEAAGAVGMKDVQVVKSDGSKLIAVQRTDLDINDRAARELAIADNRASELGLDWNLDVLKDFKVEDVDLAPFWDSNELAGLLGEPLPEAPEPKLDQAAELQKKWGTKLGQLWLIGEHRLLCGDSSSVADAKKACGGNDVSAVLTDPPYGQNQPGVSHDSPEELGRVEAAVRTLPIKNGIVVAFQSPRTFTVWLDAIRKAGHKFERMLWLDKVAQCAYPWRGWILKSESILVSTIGDSTKQWQDVHPYQHDVYRLPEVSGELSENLGWHGSVKPVSVVKDIVTRISAEAGTVFDGFLGSGTTMVAAQQTGRVCYGMEIEPKYVAVALERMADMGLKPELANG